MKYLEGGHLEEVPVQDNERLIVCSSSSVQTARTRSIINLVGMVLPPANEQYRDWSIGLACLKQVAQNVYQQATSPHLSKAASLT